MRAGPFAKIADRTAQIAVFRNFDQPRADMLAMRIAPAAIVATVAVKRTNWVEFLPFDFKRFIEKTLGVLGDLRNEPPMLGTFSFNEDILAPRVFCCRDCLQTRRA